MQYTIIELWMGYKYDIPVDITSKQNPYTPVKIIKHLPWQIQQFHLKKHSL
jgi:hypothetical protein